MFIYKHLENPLDNRRVTSQHQDVYGIVSLCANDNLKKLTMLFAALYFLLYLCCLICGAYFVSEGGDILGSIYDASIIGGIVISTLNTLPETIFFITALSSNQPTFALGAISGSVIVVCTIAVGLCIIIGSKAKEAKSMKRSSLTSESVSNSVNTSSHHHQHGRINLFAKVKQQARFLSYSLVFVVATLLFGFQTWIGIGGCISFVAFILFTLFNKTQDTKTAPEHHLSESSDEEEEENEPAWKGGLYLALGGAMIYIFSDPFIQSVVVIGESLDITPLTLAFFFAPIASEAPEILESISLSRQGKTQNINIAFSNLVGGTISKTTLLTGILSLYGVQRGFEWISPAYTVSTLLLLICAASVASFGYSANHTATSGYALIALFVASGLVQFFTALAYGANAVIVPPIE